MEIYTHVAFHKNMWKLHPCNFFKKTYIVDIAIGGIVDHHCIHFLIIILEINFYSILFRVIKYIQILFYGIYKTNIYSIKW